MIFGRSSALVEEKDDNNVRHMSRALVNGESITILFILIGCYCLLNLLNNARLFSKINFRSRHKDKWNGSQLFSLVLIILGNKIH